MNRKKLLVNLVSTIDDRPQLETARNLHAQLLSGDFMMERERDGLGNQQTKITCIYHLLDMENLFLDYAVTKDEQHPSRLAVQKSKAGECIDIIERNNHLELVNSDGVAIGRLSRKAQSEWADRLASISEARIVALVRRYRDDLADKEFQAICHGQSWEVPIVELTTTQELKPHT